MTLLRLTLVVLLLVLIAAAPFGYRALVSTSYRNFRVVEDGVLYRSGQMSQQAFERVCRERKIGTVVKLREASGDKDEVLDRAQQDFCENQSPKIAFHRLPQADWSPVNGVIPGDANVRWFVALLENPQTAKPVLVHCFAGIHRTGPLVAAYRMRFGGWSNEEAITEMMSMGTVRTTFAENLLSYLRGEHAETWPWRWRQPAIK